MKVSVNMSNSSFLNSLSSLFSNDKTWNTPLLNCLQRVISELNTGIDLKTIEGLESITLENFNDYEKSLGLLLYPVSLPALQTFAHPIFPLLLQDKNDNFYLFSKRKKYLFDARQNKQLTHAERNIDLDQMKCWQFFPVSVNLSSSYGYLMQVIIKHFKPGFILAFIAGTVLSASSLVIVAIINYIFSHVYVTGQYFKTTLFLSLGCILTALSLFSYLNDLFIKYLNIKFQMYIVPKAFQHILNINVKTLNEYTSGDIAQRLFVYETTIATLLPLSLEAFFSVFSLVFLLTYMAYCNITLAAIYLMICSAWLGIKMIFIPANIKQMNYQFAEQGKLSSFLNETLAQIPKIRSANREKSIFNTWVSYLIDIKRYAAKSLRIEMSLLLLDSLIHFGLLMSVYIIFYFARQSNAALLLQFLVCSGQFLEKFDKLSSTLWAIVNFIPGMQRIKPLLSSPTEITAPQKTLARLSGDIVFKNVCVRDVESGRLLLDNISLQIKAGQLIGFVGTSGAGKSTLFKLLLGLETPSSGIILFDKENSHHLDQQWLRKQFGVVLQTTNLLPGTIYSNITANKNISLDEAWELARNIGLDEEVQRMPMKMHTYVAEGNDSLSGGQKQKILIARALATKPKILLLDEATSALDANSQAYIYQYLNSLKITRLVIAHRYSTIKNADVIYRIAEGKITIVRSSFTPDNTEQEQAFFE
jgi:ABC-type bacteriocin/lantibiotic exporter with double-glycine peptidase domain